MAKKNKRKRQTGRVYYGPEGHETKFYWPVDVTDATKEVIINGTVAAALRAHRGFTIGCALSLTGMDNLEHFGHPVYFISVTKSTMLVVDRLKKNGGAPEHAIRYGHSYGDLVDCNDNGTLKSMVKTNPEIIERPFVLRPPRKRPTGTHGSGTHNPGSGEERSKRHSLIHHGALARAVKAGLIGEHVAEQISQAMSKRGKKRQEVVEGGPLT